MILHLLFIIYKYLYNKDRDLYNSFKIFIKYLAENRSIGGTAFLF